MKKIMFLLLLICCNVCAFAQQATFTGKISKYVPSDTLYIYVQGTNKEGYDTLVIDRKGKFTYTVNIPQLSEALVFANTGGDGDAFCVLLQPGKAIHADISLRPFSVKYSGDEAAKTVYANQYYQTFSRSFALQGDTLAARQPSFAAARSFVDAEIGKMESTVNAINDKPFAEQAQGALDDQREAALWNYAVSSEKIGHKMSADADFKAFIADIDPNDTLQVARIYPYIEWYYAAHPNLYTPMSSDGAKVKYLSEYTQNQDVRNKVANIYLMNVLFLAGWGMDTAGAELKDLYEQYLAVCTDTTYQAFVHENLARIEAQAPGEAPIDFALEAVDGTLVQFASLMGDGHVTYIDFWATWCGPCKAEIPHLDKMVTDYKEKGMLYSADNPQGKVRIISISMDANRDQWLNKLEADNPQWEQYIIPDLNNCAGVAGYNIQSIPRFMLFDAQGHLYKSAAPRPRDVETRTLIDNLIQ
jgi:thiol-disulfide isomerase/thioredoxin